jgi:hypothetical protein
MEAGLQSTPTDETIIQNHKVITLPRDRLAKLVVTPHLTPDVGFALSLSAHYL